jgi:enoyl-CoA hydratase/carnithine racemase
MSEIEIEVRDTLLSLRFNRPDKKNAITEAMYAAMAEAIETLDPKIRVILFSGAGGCFSAGNDMKSFLQSPPKDNSHPVIRFIRALPKVAVPMVAAVEGPAIGIGTTLLLHCDLVVAATTAQFGLPFVKLGLVPEAGSSLLLPNLVGTQRAAQMLLLGDPIDAKAAERFGLVTHLVEPSLLMATAEALIAKLVALPPAALRATRKLLKSAETSARIDAELAIFLERLTSPELQEAATAFLEKRPADFSKF